MFISEAFAQTAGESMAGPGGFIGLIAPMVAIMGVFYFLMIRPQQKKSQEHAAMLSKVVGTVQLWP